MAFQSRLAPPPRSPNCVSSLANPTDTEHWIEPLRVGGDAAALGRVRAAIEALPRVEIVEELEDGLRAVVTSLLFRFKDDLEVQADPEAGVVHVRSASRVGQSDLGANRKRVEALRAALEA